jgi:glycosyltransferase involved in cell wall biosynthesis
MSTTATISDFDLLKEQDRMVGGSRPHELRVAPTGPAVNGRTASTAVSTLVDREADTRRHPSVTVVIPTLNEALNLPDVLRRLPIWIDEVIIVDGHSTDETVRVAKECRPDAKIVFQDGKGKGNALASGFKQATSDITIMIDADGSTDPAEIPRFVAALTNGYDFAKGTRFVTGGGSADITKLRKIGNRAITALVNAIWGSNYSDLCYGYNAFWTRCLQSIHPDCAGFEVETLMGIRLAASDIKVAEVPSFEAPRRHGTSNLKAGRDGVRVLRTILAEWTRPS